MAAVTDHFDHAIHNHKFLKTFIKSYNYNDWAITVGFYALLHFVEFTIGSVNNLVA
jgi:hypothetical protein